ncbi:VWA domain-containing protein [Gemmata sp. G18]|uniref:VWA domain-containing protein n=1 Tax=Gemmata palustris TaxID=2822762 RepID=A0ABS5BN27_9BACT|nr:VWA domain-containing protein [Gemmata palustris]MBP3955139.1 VWA domain-containing protein [Gemmata palustris]
MNETTTTKKNEFVFRRVSDSFDQFSGDAIGAFAGNIYCQVLLALVVLALVARVTYKYANAAKHQPGAKDPVAAKLRSGFWLFLITYVVVGMYFYNVRDAEPAKGTGETLSTGSAGNVVKWYALTIGLFALGSVFVVFMYLKDTRTVRWYFAGPLALMRITVYAILCFVFLLPAMQTWEDTNKQSRVVLLLDISPSVTDVTDEIGSGAAKKSRTRMDILIEFLTDEKVAFLKNLLEKNPVAVYAFGTRLDESPTMIGQGDAGWSRADWEAFRKYDFKPFVLRGLSEAGKTQIRGVREWGDGPGTADWAQTWFARKADAELKSFSGLESEDDITALRKNLEKLDKRIDVARTITMGTNVPDSISAAINRESSNMVQGIIVLSDGRSNLGSDSSYVELRDRAVREKIPVFTITVGEERSSAAITITDVQAPDSAPIDEAWKIIVEADGVNLANKEVEVFLDLWLPGRDIKAVGPDHQITQKLTFAPGDPPHGQTEFVIDPAKLPETLTVESKDAAIKKRVLPEGKWSARARIAKDPLEAFPDPEHISAVREVNVVQQKLRILLMAGAPSREFSFLRTLLVREVMDKRASLTTFVQNDAGTTGKLTAEQDELVIPRFPTKFDLKPAIKDDPEKAYNLNEYDVIVAFDPDWSELSVQQAEDLRRWVKEGGGGLIYVAGPINTFQLARVEKDSRLDPVLDVLPVQPADIIAVRFKGTPRTPRRLYLNSKAIIGSDLLKLDDKVADDPVAGWERFFTDREKYVPDGDLKSELFPARGFFSCYPLKADVGIGGVKAGSAVLAEFADVGDTGELVKLPYLVTNNPSASWRTCFLASGEFYKMRVFEPGEGTGREYFERIWIKMIKYMAGKRNIKAPRGRVLVAKEAVSGAPLRVQARVLNESARPYDITAAAPKFTIVQEPAGGGDKRSFGPFDLAPKTNPGGAFDGYYGGQVLLDPKTFAAGEALYRVEIDVPDSSEKLSGEFKIRAADPEMDNKKPDFPSMLRMASEFDKDFQARLPDKVKVEFGTKLPKDAGVHRLAFKVGEPELLKLIPECMVTKKVSTQNRGPVNDLWDRGFDMPTWTPESEGTNKYLASWWSGQRLSVVMLAVIFLLSFEWLGRKLLRLA